MARTSYLEEVLRTAEDVLLFFDDYFSNTKWVYNNSGLSEKKSLKSKWYLVKNEFIDNNLNLENKPKDIQQEITKPWNGFWQVVIYDVPEEKAKIRKMLHYHLYELGFRNLQRSVMVSPFHIKWVIKKTKNLLDDPQGLFCFSSKLPKNDSIRLVDSLWEAETWEQKARLLIQKLKNKEKITNSLKRDFWVLISEHPTIPLDLLPSRWPLKKLTKTFRRCCSKN